LRRRYDALTPREREVMQLVVSGLLNKEIAAELGTSEITIKTHRGQVMRKMRAESFADLVRMAERLGIPATRY
jgi:FixJ family two-component response regulator